MALAAAPIFASQFDAATQRALPTGVVEGCTHGVPSALINLAEALLFCVGATPSARREYMYLQMVELPNLVFLVTIGAQLMAFTECIAKAV